MFRVGQKVVCVNATSGLLGVAGRWDDVLTKGEIYTVRWIGAAELRGINYDGIRLAGIIREDIDDTPFHSSRFRPLVETKTDISIFTEMLTKEPVDA